MRKIQLVLSICSLVVATAAWGEDSTDLFPKNCTSSNNVNSCDSCYQKYGSAKKSTFSDLKKCFKKGDVRLSDSAVKKLCDWNAVDAPEPYRYDCYITLGLSDPSTMKQYCAAVSRTWKNSTLIGGESSSDRAYTDCLAGLSGNNCFDGFDLSKAVTPDGKALQGDEIQFVQGALDVLRRMTWDDGSPSAGQLATMNKEFSDQEIGPGVRDHKYNEYTNTVFPGDIFSFNFAKKPMLVTQGRTATFLFHATANDQVDKITVTSLKSAPPEPVKFPWLTMPKYFSDTIEFARDERGCHVGKVTGSQSFDYDKCANSQPSTQPSSCQVYTRYLKTNNLATAAISSAITATSAQSEAPKP